MALPFGTETELDGFMSSNIDPADLPYTLICEVSGYFSFSVDEMEELIGEVKHRLTSIGRELSAEETRDIFETMLTESSYSAEELVRLAQCLDLSNDVLDELTAESPMTRVEKHFCFDTHNFKKLNKIRELRDLELLSHVDLRVLTAIYITSFLIGQDEASLALEDLLEEHGVDFWIFLSRSWPFLDAGGQYEEEIPIAADVLYMKADTSSGIENRQEYRELLERYGLTNHPWVGLAAMEKYIRRMFPPNNPPGPLHVTCYEIFTPDPDEFYDS